MSPLTNNSRRVLVTGPTGFIGRRLCTMLRSGGYGVRAALYHSPGDNLTDTIADESIVIGNINSGTDWSRALAGIDSIVHLAARVHVMQEHDSDPLSAYRAVNTHGTARLALAAATSGVRRMVFVSTIKVNGETTVDRPFQAQDTPQPEDDYAVSKWEAEQAIHQIASETGLEVVIVRPPLVYGPGVRGNFLRLLHMIKRGVPLPVGACRNKRSLVSLDNLTSLLTHCLAQPQAAGKTFLVSDGEDLSTPELVIRLAKSLNRQPRLLSVPPAWLEFAAKLIGKAGVYDRLCGSLQLDIRYTREVLGWAPPVSIEDELGRTAQWFINQDLRS